MAVVHFFMKNQGKRPVYWEDIDGESQKFWAASILKQDQKFVLVRKWGRIGTKGQSMEQVFDDLYDAEKALDRLIWDKEKKGYKAKF